MLNLIQKKFIEDKIFFIVSFFIFFVIYIPFWITTVDQTNNYLKHNTGVPPIFNGDAFEYKTLADNLVAGKGFTMGNYPEIFRTPGYPVFIAFFYFIFHSYFAVTFFQIILSFIGSYFIYLIVKKRFGLRWAIFSFLIYILEPTVILHSLLFLSDNFFVFILIFATYILFDWNTEKSILKNFTLGLLIGISVLIRPISLFIIPVFMIVSVYKKEYDLKKIFRLSLIMLLGFMIIIVPWMFRNYIKTKTFSVSTVSSYNLFYYNAPMFLSWKTGNSHELILNNMIDEYLPNKKDLRSPENVSYLSKYPTEVISHNIFSYSYFHTIKTIPFFLSSSIKTFSFNWNNITGRIEKNEEKVIMSDLLLSGNFHKIFKIAKTELLSVIERLLWLSFLFISCISVFDKKNRIFSIFCLFMIFYFAVLTGPVSYARYRLPAEIYMFLIIPSGLLEIQYFYKKAFKNYEKK